MQPVKHTCISAGTNMHNFSDLLIRLSFSHSSLSVKYSSVLLIKPSIAAKRKRGERKKWKICYGWQWQTDLFQTWRPPSGFGFMFERDGPYKRWLKSCTYHILHIAKYKSTLESTRQPTLVAWRDGLSNLENAWVPSLRPAFQSALYHAMKRKKKNNQWELAQTVFNTKVMKWWRRRIAWFYNVAWVT